MKVLIKFNKYTDIKTIDEIQLSNLTFKDKINLLFKKKITVINK